MQLRCVRYPEEGVPATQRVVQKDEGKIRRQRLQPDRELRQLHRHRVDIHPVEAVLSDEESRLRAALRLLFRHGIARLVAHRLPRRVDIEPLLFRDLPRLAKTIPKVTRYLHEERPGAHRGVADLQVEDFPRALENPFFARNRRVFRPAIDDRFERLARRRRRRRSRSVVRPRVAPRGRAREIIRVLKVDDGTPPDVEAQPVCVRRDLPLRVDVADLVEDFFRNLEVPFERLRVLLPERREGATRLLLHIRQERGVGLFPELLQLVERDDSRRLLTRRDAQPQQEPIRAARRILQQPFVDVPDSLHVEPAIRQRNRPRRRFENLERAQQEKDALIVHRQGIRGRLAPFRTRRATFQERVRVRIEEGAPVRDEADRAILDLPLLLDVE